MADLASVWTGVGDLTTAGQTFAAKTREEIKLAEATTKIGEDIGIAKLLGQDGGLSGMNQEEWAATKEDWAVVVTNLVAPLAGLPSCCAASACLRARKSAREMQRTSVS